MGVRNVTIEEEQKFGHDPEATRQIKYAKKILKNGPGESLIDLKNKLKWKFGTCVLSKEKLVELAH